MKRMKANKSSSLLSQEENEEIFSLLGYKSLALATTVAELWQANNQRDREWKFKNVGVLCLVKDSYHKSYFLRLYCLRVKMLLWKQEIYRNMEYLAPKTFLHTFEAEKYVVALNFADEIEANFLREILLRVVIDRHKQGSSVNRGNEPKYSVLPANRVDLNISSPQVGKYDFRTPKGRGNTSSNKIKKKKRISKSDISKPTDFWHITHLTPDRNKAFDYRNSGLILENPLVREFIDEAGVSQKHLEDKDTVHFICDFIEGHGGVEAVRKHSLRTNPKEPNSFPPHMRKTFYGALSQRSPIHDTSANIYEDIEPLYEPIFPQQSVPPRMPPPPPPPIVYLTDNGVIKKPKESLEENHISELSIKQNEEKSLNPRGDVLEQIRQGIELKPISKSKEVRPNLEHNSRGGLAEALRKALDSRALVIQSNSEDEDENDGDWD